MKQTAIQWLADEIIILEERLRQEKINLNDFMDLKDDLVTKALELEEEQIKDAWNDGNNRHSGIGDSETYYDEITKK